MRLRLRAWLLRTRVLGERQGGDLDMEHLECDLIHSRDRQKKVLSRKFMDLN